MSTAIRPPRSKDRRPLYLDRARGMRVELDGPALQVEVPDQALRLFPLRRLSRVYVQAGAEWTTEALLACGERGISVLFTDADGKIISRLLGRPGHRDEIHQRFVDFFTRPDAAESYRTWRLGTQRHALLWAARKLRVSTENISVPAMQQWVRHSAAVYCGTECAKQTRRRLHTLAYSWMQAHLQVLGFGAGNELGQDGCPNLVEDLTSILVWYLEPARLGWLSRRWRAALRKGQPVRPPQRVDVIRLFESRNARAANRGRALTNQFHRWLVEIA